MNILTDSVLGRFNQSGVSSVRHIDSSRGENDLRQTALVQYADGVRLAVKAARNCFTTPERVHAWADLVRAYRAVHVYCPQYVPTVDGELCFCEDSPSGRVLIYAEEFSPYRSVDESDPPVSPDKYEEDAIETIGKIAAHPASPVAWHSAYCLYDRFCEEDETDETHANALALFSLLDGALPGRKDEINGLRTDYLALRSSFEAEYRSLPTAVFQADLNDKNILLTEDGRFAGLIDFNLSGSEPVLNYALCECLSLPTDETDLPLLSDARYCADADRTLLKNLSLVARHYAFTDAEKRAFPKLYRLITPFRWPTFCLLRWALRNQKAEFFDSILGWVLYQFYRTDLML